MPDSATTVLGAMATPAVLLLANAMLILSTIQRLQAILHRIREAEDRLDRVAADDPACDEMLEELRLESRRAGMAHRGLLAFYGAAVVLLAMVGTLGASAYGWEAAVPVSLGAAFVGIALLVLGAALLAGETWIGVRAIDGRIDRILRRRG